MIKNFILKGMSFISFMYIVLYICALDGLTNMQLLKGGLIAIPFALFLGIFVYVNYKEELFG